MKKFYYLYKITNKVNNKFYIGVHSTNDLNDGYKGSGTALIKAYNKYGLQFFKKEILEFFNNKEEMYKKEAEIVDLDFTKRKDTYNLTVGGEGGFEHINMCKIKKIWICNKEKKQEKLIKEGSEIPKGFEKGRLLKLENRKGKNNPAFGKMWIHNPYLRKNKFVDKDYDLQIGWKKGRKFEYYE